jgi:hypothetical protein
MQTVPDPPAVVIDAAVVAVDRLGYQISALEPAGGQVFVLVPRRFDRSPWRLSVGVTDSGFGTSNVNVSWEDERPVPWPKSPAGRSASRLLRTTVHVLGERPDDRAS